MSREAVLALIRQKDELEQKIDGTRAELFTHGVSEFDTLLTPEGFPRADLDIPTIRSLRVQLIREENDLKALIERISVELQSAFPPKSDNSSEETAQELASTKPLGRIRTIVSGSAGELAGLQADDLVMAFGKAKKLSDLGSELSAAVSRGLSVRVTVQRAPLWKNTDIDVFTPQGRSLGCHIVPV